MKMKTFRVMDTPWLFRVVTTDEFLGLFPDDGDASAVTMADTQEVFFIAEDFNLGLVRHEVRHTFLAELCIDDANLTIEQFEEINCTLDEKRWDDMGKLSLKVFETFSE